MVDTRLKIVVVVNIDIKDSIKKIAKMNNRNVQGEIITILQDHILKNKPYLEQLKAIEDIKKEESIKIEKKKNVKPDVRDFIKDLEFPTNEEKDAFNKAIHAWSESKKPKLLEENI